MGGDHTYKTMTVGSIFYRLKTNKINTSPSYQRDIVWNESKQKGLIQTLLEGYPIPSLNLVKNGDKSLPDFECMDGKNRLESIRLFMTDNLDVTYDDDEYDEQTVSWTDLSVEEQEDFKNIEVQVCVFENLSPEKRQTYFRRIQMGCVLRQPEILWSMETNPIVKLVREIRSKYLTEINVIWTTTKRYTDLNFLINLLAVIISPDTDVETASAGHSTAMTRWVTKYNDVTDLPISELRVKASNMISQLHTIITALPDLRCKYRSAFVLDLIRIVRRVGDEHEIRGCARELNTSIVCVLGTFCNKLIEIDNDHMLLNQGQGEYEKAVNYYRNIFQSTLGSRFSLKKIHERFNILYSVVVV